MSEDKSLIVTRVITIYDGPTNQTQEINTATDKWSEIVEEINIPNVVLSKREAILASTEGILRLPNALIPEGDQTIFLSPAKQSSGAVDYDTMSYTELRRAASGKEGYNLGGNPTSDALRKFLKNTKEYKEAKPKQKKEVAKQDKQKAIESTPDLTKEVERLTQIALKGNVHFSKFLTGLSTLVKDLQEEVKSSIVIKEEVIAKPIVRTTPVSTSKQDLATMYNKIMNTSSKKSVEEEDEE